MNFTASNSVLNPAFLPSLSLFPHRPATQKPKTLFPISCDFPEKHPENHGEDEKFKRASLKLLQSTVTLTVISASLPKPSSATAKLSEKRRLSKKTESLTPEEELIYSETTSPQPYPSSLSNIPEMMHTFVFNLKPKQKPKSKKALELKRAREALQIAKDEELLKLRKLRVQIAEAAEERKRKEARKRRKEIQKMKYQQSLIQAADDRAMSMVWAELAEDQTFTTFLGVVFFWIFYQMVLIYKKKKEESDDRLQKKDYDDRLKIEEAKEREMERIDSADEL